MKEIEDLLQFHARISSPKDLNNAICLQNLIDTGKMIASAARLRKESRGSHYRSDYISIDEALAKNIILEKQTLYFE